MLNFPSGRWRAVITQPRAISPTAEGTTNKATRLVLAAMSAAASFPPLLRPWPAALARSPATPLRCRDRHAKHAHLQHINSCSTDSAETALVGLSWQDLVHVSAFLAYAPADKTERSCAQEPSATFSLARGQSNRSYGASLRTHAVSWQRHPHATADYNPQAA